MQRFFSCCIFCLFSLLILYYQFFTFSAGNDFGRDDPKWHKVTMAGTVGSGAIWWPSDGAGMTAMPALSRVRAKPNKTVGPHILPRERKGKVHSNLTAQAMSCFAPTPSKFRANNQTLARYVLTTSETVELMSLIRDFKNIMQSNNLTFFMYGGTLIGSYRHHGIIPWDDDFDVFVPAQIKADLLKVLTRFPKYKLAFGGPRWKLFSRNGKRIRSRIRWRFPFLDLCFYGANATHIWDIDAFLKNSFVYERRMVFPLVQRPFLNFMLPAPLQTDRFLRQTYPHFDTKCATTTYNHRTERRVRSKPKIYNCSQLTSRYPFVFRKQIALNGCIEEILKIGNRTLSRWRHKSSTPFIVVYSTVKQWRLWQWRQLCLRFGLLGAHDINSSCKMYEHSICDYLFKTYLTHCRCEIYSDHLLGRCMDPVQLR